MGWPEDNHTHVCATRGGRSIHSLPWLIGGAHDYPDPEWWMECLPTRSTLPPFSMPAAVGALRARAEGDRCPRRGRAVNETQMLRSLAAAAPENPSVLVLVVSNGELESLPSSGMRIFSRLAVAATALYSAAHGYRMLFYDGQQACNQPLHKVALYGKPPDAHCGSGSGPSRCCFEGGWWLTMNWLKPAAIIDAIKRYPGAQWMLSLDTDAAPTHLAYPVETVIAWAAQARLHQRCKAAEQGSGLMRCHSDPERAAPIDPSAVRTVLSRDIIMDPGVDAGRSGFDQINTGALLLKLGDSEVRKMVGEWWDSRNSLCRPGVPLFHHRLRHARAFASGDQTGFSVWIFPNRSWMISEVQHFMQGHGGLFYTHLYSKKSFLTVARFAETVARHAAGLTALLCGNGTGDCGQPRRIAAGETHRKCAANQFGVVSLWAAEWARAALSPEAGIVHRHKLRWPQEAPMSHSCFKLFNLLNRMHHPKGVSKGRRGRRR
eukprot:TRINITY_DN27492_c0_g1_i2.p2 TRINITY_DN27492_c0_g1~~TRINITY_DN27492_c0_g1_i2.p2  ORF type:complete len:490 (+),score=146.28 TRINITY_DN27492_c0_g1_i2:487-1956(+)